jgi:hypothetical protein
VVVFALLAVGAMAFGYLGFVVVFLFFLTDSFRFEVVFGCNLGSCSSGFLFS